MSYTKQTWTARVGTFLNRFLKTSETTTHVELTNDPGDITVAGTPFTADRMNYMEEGIRLGNDPATILANLLTVDGTASGLDADLLDGQHGSYYLATSSYTAADVLTKILTVDTDTSGLNSTTVKGMSQGQSGTNYLVYADASGTVLVGTTQSGFYSTAALIVTGGNVMSYGYDICMAGPDLGSGKRTLTYLTNINANTGGIGVWNDFANVNANLAICPNGGKVLINSTTDDGSGAVVQVNGAVSANGFSKMENLQITSKLRFINGLPSFSSEGEGQESGSINSGDLFLVGNHVCMKI